MGIWGAIKSVGRAVGGAIKKGVEVVVDTAKKVGSAVKNGATNLWNKASGKEKFEEAERLYAEISARYNSRRNQFEEDVENYTNKIENHVNQINRSKEKIKSELFLEMAKKMEKIKDIEVSKDFSVESYIAEAVSFDSIRSKSELYKIDFNKHKFKTTVQAIVTLGFYTRKKAKETLYAVEEEEGKINTEIAKMDAEIVKLKTIESSLDNVELYFSSLIELYQNLLIRLDSSVNYLFVRSMAFAHKLVNTEMSIRRLPKMQQKEVEAIITASKILKAMTDAQITAIDDKDCVSSYSREMKNQHVEMERVYQAA